MAITTTGPYISKITVPDLGKPGDHLNNVTKTYEIKDAWARDMINTLSGSAINYRGKTKTTLVTGKTDPNIQIYIVTSNGSSIQESFEAYTAVRGDVVLYIDPDKTAELRSSYTGSNPDLIHYTVEFIYDGVSWQEFGSTSEFGELAFKDSASASYKPAGTVSKPTFTGTAVRLVTGNIPVPTSAAFTGTAVRLVTGNIPVPSEYTSTFSNGAASVPISYTPAGNVGTPTISLKTAGSTTSVTDKYIMTDLKYGRTLNDTEKADYVQWPNIFSVDSENETLKFDELWFRLVGAVSGSYTDAVNLDRLGSTRQTYQLKDSDGVYQSSQPSWTGTKWTTTLTGTVTGTVATTTKSTANKTTTVSVAASGDATYTPAGTIALTNTNKTATVSAASSGTTTYTPSGTVSQPTFTGTQATITVQ